MTRTRLIAAASTALGALLLCGCPRHAAPEPEAPIPEAARDEEVTFTSAGLALEGILSIPERLPDTRSPAVALVHGSGPQGRDEVLPLNFPQATGLSVATFRDLGSALTDAGYVVLRYDKRSCGTFNEMCDNDYPFPDGVRVSDFEADAAAGLDFLASRAEVDPAQLIIAGHSQGASFVPRLLAERDDLVTGVLLAGGYRPIDELLAWQAVLQRNLALEAGMTQSQVDAAFADLDQLVLDLAAIRAGTYTGDAVSEDEQAFWLEWMQITDGVPDVARTVAQPMLAISGDYDWNIPPEETEAWGALFDEIENDPGHRAMVLPCLTHGLNCVHEADWLQVQPDDVETEVSDELIAAVVAFLNES